MRLQTRKLVLFTLGAMLVASAGSTPSLAFGGDFLQWLHDHFHGPRVEPPCVLYAVQDSGLSDSSLLRIDLRDPNSGDPFVRLTTLDDCDACDIEATALNIATGDYLGIAGGDATSTAPLPAAGELFRINRFDGALTVIGQTGATGAAEIVGASFRPLDQTLWAFQQSVGLVTVGTGTAALTLEFDITGATDQNGIAVGDNWEGLAWDEDGDWVYGANNAVLYRWNPVGRQVQTVCGNLVAAAGAMVEALEFSTNGVLIGAINANPNRALIAIDFPDSPAGYGPNACTVTDLTLPDGPSTDDIESLAFETCDTVPSSCDAGRPRALVFEYTGESCAATNNAQGGRFFCWGDPGGREPVRIYPGVLSGAQAIPGGQTIGIGDQVTILATGNRLHRDTWLYIKQGWRKLQKVKIHTSCSRRLEVGDQFGSLILQEFIP